MSIPIMSLVYTYEDDNVMLTDSVDDPLSVLSLTDRVADMPSTITVSINSRRANICSNYLFFIVI